jgi:hypothetical protein
MKIVHAAAKTSDFLKVFAIYRAIETDFAANFCDTCLPHIHRRSNLLFWELFGVNLCSLFGVKLGHAGAGGVVGRGSGYCVITLPAA